MGGFIKPEEEVALLRALTASLKRSINDPDTAWTIAVLSAKVANQAEQLRQMHSALTRKSWALKQQRRVLDQLFVNEQFRLAYLNTYRSISGTRIVIEKLRRLVGERQ